MGMLDVNILVYAHREDSPAHARYAMWVTAVANGLEPFALSGPVLQDFVRIVTNPRIFNPPSSIPQAFEFIDALRTRPQCVMVRPGPGIGDYFGSFAKRVRHRVN